MALSDAAALVVESGHPREVLTNPRHERTLSGTRMYVLAVT
ncbi:hypothetical protein [Streptomyces malaysiensis]